MAPSCYCVATNPHTAKNVNIKLQKQLKTSENLSALFLFALYTDSFI